MYQPNFLGSERKMNVLYRLAHARDRVFRVQSCKEDIMIHSVEGNRQV